MSDCKIVLVTGGAKRIGRTIALHMANNGWDVAIHYNNSEKDAEDVANEVMKIGRSAEIFKSDLANKNETQKLLPEINKKLGKVTCLINNASNFENDGIDSIDSDKWDTNITVNLHAPLILTKYFVEQLGDESGNVVNLLDYCVWNYPDNFLSYSLSKSALWSATQILAKNLAPGVRVNAIGPGHSLRNKEDEGRFKDAILSTPLGYCGSPNDISAAIDFILSAKSMTGQMIALDGGKHLIGAEFY